MPRPTPNLAIALLHHPVLNKRGETLGSAVTNLDLHDISRAARTYGVRKYFVASPYEDQRHLVGEITDYWQNGHGASANPARKEALSIIRVVDGLGAILEEMQTAFDRPPLVVATSARRQPNQLGFGELKAQLRRDSKPVLLLFGTAHGLAPELMAKTDAVLEPIGKHSDYNHLSVRSAVAIILDRLLGDRDDNST